MASKRQRRHPDPWTDEQAEQVRGVLKAGSDAETVCALTDADPADLDWLCEQAFGMGFDAADRKFKLIGTALMNRSLFEAACDGNARSTDIWLRLNKGFSPLSAKQPRQEKKEPTEKLEL